MRTTRLRTLAGALTLGAVLVACSSGDDVGETAASSSASAPVADLATSEEAGSAGGIAGMADAGEAVAADAPVAVDAAAAVPGAVPNTGAQASREIAKGAGKANANKLAIPDAVLADRDVIYTADMTVQVEDVTKAVSQVESAVRAAGGLVAGSSRSTEAPRADQDLTDDEPAPAPRTSAEMVLRIPPGEFDSALDRIGALGMVLDRNLTGQDVTEAVVDVKSRIASARTSVARIRDLMDRAVTLRDVVALEGELSQRESDLESLLAKQAKLSDQTSLATVTVRLVTAETADALAAEEDEKGFGAGLRDGWSAFTDGMVVAATVLGAVLPFAIALAVLIPAGLWIAVRVRRSLAQVTAKDALG